MKKINLTGRVFGRLKVLREAGRNKHGKTLWECVCQCLGEQRKTVITARLISGHTQSCGCLGREARHKYNHRFDLIGQVFGRLKILREVGKKQNQRLWEVECQCPARTVFQVCTKYVKNGNTKSCGCLQKEMTSKASYQNLVAEKFGRLQVICEIGKDERGRLWEVECQCPAKTRFQISTGELNYGRTKSCGCIAREKVASRRSNLVGRSFGRLKVLRDSGNRYDGRILWEVECQCPTKTIFQVPTNRLKSGNTKSCGCWKTEMNRFIGKTAMRLDHAIDQFSAHMKNPAKTVRRLQEKLKT